MLCQKCGKKKREKREHFTIYVTIIEGRHFAWPNMDSFVLLNVDNQLKCTKICKNTDCPYFNEFFVFDYFTQLDKILDSTIKLTVIQPRTCCRKKRTLGFFSLDVGTIWYQTDHQFYHKWAVITSDDVASGPKGYLKVDLGIKTKNQVPRLPLVSAEDTDIIEGNLLLPEGVALERQRAQYIFNVYKGTDFINCKDKVFVEIIFAGHKGRTSTLKNSEYVHWNERIIFTELFPPLCQRIVVNLYYKTTCRSFIQAKRYITLSSISNNKEKGYLPTFGPSYLYFYRKEEQGFGYTGCLLISMNTKVEGETDMPSFKGKKVLVEKTDGLNEASLWYKEDIRLYGIIFDVTLIDKKFSNKQISFELSFGENDDNDFNKSLNLKPKCVNKYFCHLEYNEDKPCLMVSQQLPDFRRRMFNANRIKKIVDKLKSKIEEMQELFEEQEYFRDSQEIEDKLLEVIEFIKTACEKYINTTATTQGFVTKLDQERKKYCINEMNAIIKVLPKIYESKRKMKSFRRIQKIYRKIEPLSENAQDGWPDIFVCVNVGNTRLAFKQIPAKEVLFSSHFSERGGHCGIIQTIFFEPPSNLIELFESKLICKIDILLWIGLQKERNHFYNLIPNGYSYAGDGSPVIHSDQQYIFQCRAHIYQGEISPGYDESGLADSFVRVVIGQHSAQTKIKPDTLDPLWDQTLIMKNIIIFGSREFIKQNPPTAVVEIYDQDLCYKIEFVGRNTFAPVVKTMDDRYIPPIFPPKLQWLKIINSMGEDTADILLCIELLEVTDKEEIDKKEENQVIPIPKDIKPQTALYRIEILFWGVRKLKKLQLLPISNPKIHVSCYEDGIYSDSVRIKDGLNFLRSCMQFDVYLPENQEFVPPIVIKMFETRGLRNIYAGSTLTHVSSFLVKPVPKMEWEQIMLGLLVKSVESFKFGEMSSILFSAENIVQKLILQPITERSLPKLPKKGCFLKRIFKKKKKPKISSIFDEENYDIDLEDETNDWWNKYYVSSELKVDDTLKSEAIDQALKDVQSMHQLSIKDTEKLKEKEIEIPKTKITLKIYNRELESLPQFQSFADVLVNFPIYKGKKSGDETVDNEKITGIFKGNLKIYKIDNDTKIDYVTSSGLDLQKGYFQDAPSNEVLNFIIRVYCVKGLYLKPKDLSGKSDPYIYVKMGKQEIKDRENYIAKQVSPIFGKCFEFKGTFPFDNSLLVQIWDYDKQSSDDLIGETIIDIENRYYTKYRAKCGLAKRYFQSGNYAWRDYQAPSDILEGLCLRYNLGEPIYKPTYVQVACKLFVPHELLEKHKKTTLNTLNQGDNELNNELNEYYQQQAENYEEISDFHKECLALNALHHWHEFPLIGYTFVPEHVETRSLYHPARPGIEQGKLEMWVDIFPTTDLLPPPKVDITPRKPVIYELRVVIWNVENVLLVEDDFFAGEKRSDIYVKGWLSDKANEQNTDVHYRSLTGEGNFNWRFIFPFKYLASERRMVLMKKDKMFSEEYEHKIPCKLTLQVWDNDTFSKDDFIGSITMELAKFPKGARSAKQCDLKILSPHAPIFNLFKVRRTKGWWPFEGMNSVTKRHFLAGKVEAEFELLALDDAQGNPAGLGRNPPLALPPPNRPDTSFSWFRNPWRSFKFIICKQWKWRLIFCLIIIILIGMAIVALYTLPKSIVSKLVQRIMNIF